MTQEEKQLLLGDLCARLPYHTIVRYRNADVDLTQYARSIKFVECVPYLRPMSSMTEEEFKELSEIDGKRIIYSARHLTWHIDGEVIDFFNRKILDWRGLIPKGLALEAPEDMYK